jgi:mRNA interferase MazF
MKMQRGDIYLTDLSPVKGSEAKGVRPVIIVSNDAANSNVADYKRGVITIVPLTTNVSKVFPIQVFIPAEVSGLERDSKAQTEQLRALAFERFLRPLSSLPSRYIAELGAALRLHLNL